MTSLDPDLFHFSGDVFPSEDRGHARFSNLDLRYYHSHREEDAEGGGSDEECLRQITEMVPSEERLEDKI